MNMPSVALPSEQLRRERKQAVRRLVAPLLPQPPNAIVAQIGPGRDAFTLGIVPNNRQPASFLNPEEPLVQTRTSGLLLNYYETWKLIATTDNYYLDRAYMHIHLGLRHAQPRQVFSLHCDPEMHHSEEHYTYKRGPHIHVEGANPNVDRAHISLCLLDAELGGADIRRLTQSFSAAIRMVLKELVPCWERAARI
jgi:hypothetical protein